MSQRVPKVESVVQSVAAKVLFELLEKDAAYVTVTRVDVSPDLRNGILWIGMLGDETQQERIWSRIEGVRLEIQREISSAMKTRVAPRLEVKRDTGGAYAADIERLLRGL